MVSCSRLLCSGSAWVEYTKSGTMHGIELPKGMKESTQFIPPLFTPSTKAELGDKDENIHPDKRELLLSFTPPFPSSQELYEPPFFLPQLKPTDALSSTSSRHPPRPSPCGASQILRPRPLLDGRAPLSLPRPHPRRHQIRIRPPPSSRLVPRLSPNPHARRRVPYARFVALLACKDVG